MTGTAKAAASRRALVEQLRASDWTPEAIADHLRMPLEDVWSVFVAQDAVVDGRDEPLTTAAGKPLGCGQPHFARHPKKGLRMSIQNFDFKVPRLGVGPGPSDGSGSLCAMQIISWESGDTTITDYPACADRLLASIVQRVNDNICDHRQGDLLCPPCSQKVLDLGHRTVGTGTLPLTEQERKVVWVSIAIDLARSVFHLVPAKHKGAAAAALDAAQAWIDNPCAETEAYAATAAYATTAATAAYAATAAATAAYAATAAATAAYAATAAATAAYAAVRLQIAHRAIDTFERLTAHVYQPVSDETVKQAYACMTL